MSPRFAVFVMTWYCGVMSTNTDKRDMALAAARDAQNIAITKAHNAYKAAMTAAEIIMNNAFDQANAAYDTEVAEIWVEWATSGQAELNNKVAREGCDFCFCGCKYWENDTCVDCGTHINDVPQVVRDRS